MATETEVFALYGSLRTAMLARHFALNRWWRVDHFSTWNYLGDPPAVVPPATYSIGGGWRVPAAYHGVSGASGLRTKTARAENTGAQADLAALEREPWRVVQHDRENSLMMAGMRLAQLAIEHRLGEPSAVHIIRRILETLRALCPFTGDYAGYMLRQDPVSAYDWLVTVDERGHEQPRLCKSFLINPDASAWLRQPYLLSVPLDDPRYLAHERRHYVLRGHEPSMDEFVGLIAGLAMVGKLVRAGGREAMAVQVLVRQLARDIGTYLAESGYLLIRPNGGFTARGAAGLLPAMEQPLEHALRGIASDGTQFFSRRTYEQALERAGVAACLRQQVSGYAVDVGAVTARLVGLMAQGGLTAAALGQFVASVTPPGFLEQVLVPSLLDGILALLKGQQLAPNEFVGGLAAASGSFAGRSCFDVSDNNARSEFALAAMTKHMPLGSRLPLVMRQQGQSFSGGFRPFLGLMAYAQGDATTAKEYLAWYDANLASVDPNAVDEVALDDGATKDGESVAWYTAVALLLRQSRGDPRADADAVRLANMVGRCHDRLLASTGGRPRLEDYENQTGIVIEALDRRRDPWPGGFMIAAAGAWLFAHERQLSGGTPPARALVHHAATQRMPRVRVPADVVAEASAGRLPVPIRAFRTPGPDNRPGDFDLFAAPPARPRHPARLAWEQPPMVQADARGRLLVAVVGNDRRIWTRTQTAPNSGWGEWSLLPGNTVVTAARLAANQDGRLELFAQGDADAVFHSWQGSGDGFGTWHRLGDRCRGFGVGRDGAGRLTVVVSRRPGGNPGPGDSVATVRQATPNSGWANWHAIGTLEDAGRVLVCGQHNGWLHMFVAAYGHLWQRWQVDGNGTWNESGWLLRHSAFEAVDFAAGNNRDGRLELFVVDQHGGVRHCWQLSPDAVTASGAGWSSWQSLGQGIDAERVCTARNADGRLSVFVVAHGRVLHTAQLTAGGAWGRWHVLARGGPDGRVRTIAVCGNLDGRLEVFANCEHGDLWHAWQRWPGGQWLHWESLMP